MMKLQHDSLPLLAAFERRSNMMLKQVLRSLSAFDENDNLNLSSINERRDRAKRILSDLNIASI